MTQWNVNCNNLVVSSPHPLICFQIFFSLITTIRYDMRTVKLHGLFTYQPKTRCTEDVTQPVAIMPHVAPVRGDWRHHEIPIYSNMLTSQEYFDTPVCSSLLEARTTPSSLQKPSQLWFLWYCREFINTWTMSVFHKGGNCSIHNVQWFFFWRGAVETFAGRLGKRSVLRSMLGCIQRSKHVFQNNRNGELKLKSRQ